MCQEQTFLFYTSENMVDVTKVYVSSCQMTAVPQPFFALYILIVESVATLLR
jgi:hypothetical protein